MQTFVKAHIDQGNRGVNPDQTRGGWVQKLKRLVSLYAARGGTPVWQDFCDGPEAARPVDALAPDSNAVRWLSFGRKRSRLLQLRC